MKVVETNFTDAKLLEPRLFGDERGFFTESYNKKVLETLGITYSFVQDNVSYSAQAGTIRGLHFQKNPKAQTKLIQVMQGAIYDVIVDLRKDSPTFKQWRGYILSADNHRQLLVPKGFAHGFCTLVPHTTVMYKVDEYYSADHDSGLLWEDKELAIPWPVTNPILSDKDRILPLLQEYEDSF
ncbi:dTDP-4-dehydrorhamnose 3,5-epimerase [Bacillus cereus]|uniref:dTDP-4-dehydrorhamnose 3,5-epimerase n=1 Tax=Bacillus cereus TaxID=1396 RepID=A0A2A8LKC2_BACCE|nr:MULTISPECIES: dTDP-4-dehydrorhamnose 3,5-epimerase [Bacillus cereus group]MDR4985704.1 dTDP-4-dehydrorhamnose 3,5-epimerase [Bacillus cereus]MEA1009841.1 dTDP-4-dehydrorhamnose 3,5-epimerase [Bacillus cereus]PES93219.1 dTDP-4-dehydrorhamnose 3,5-epimerase [Bacillus cereus]PFP77743.1 dTDP-4-dehydrorhamnose 3,5-epimerase [Bacillus cereus]